jgi:hypothetical protein
MAELVCEEAHDYCCSTTHAESSTHTDGNIVQGCRLSAGQVHERRRFVDAGRRTRIGQEGWL